MTMLGPKAFLGSWQLQREIADHLTGQVGQMSGQVVFTSGEPGHLQYREVGELRFGDGPVMVAEREYLWRFEADGVDVSFADGKSFHRFVPGGQVAGTDHPCGDDLYQVKYDFTRWTDWSAVWDVAGPRKDYTSTSYYCR